MNEDDRKTDPDSRSPYEHVLDELNAIKALCESTNRWQGVTMLASFCAFVLGACALAK